MGPSSGLPPTQPALQVPGSRPHVLTDQDARTGTTEQVVSQRGHSLSPQGWRRTRPARLCHKGHPEPENIHPVCPRVTGKGRKPALEGPAEVAVAKEPLLGAGLAASPAPETRVALFHASWAPAMSSGPCPWRTHPTSAVSHWASANGTPHCLSACRGSHRSRLGRAPGQPQRPWAQHVSSKLFRHSMCV